MISWHGYAFHITGLLWEYFTGHRWSLHMNMCVKKQISKNLTCSSLSLYLPSKAHRRFRVVMMPTLSSLMASWRQSWHYGDSSCSIGTLIWCARYTTMPSGSTRKYSITITLSQRLASVNPDDVDVMTWKPSTSHWGEHNGQYGASFYSVIKRSIVNWLLFSLRFLPSYNDVATSFNDPTWPWSSLRQYILKKLEVIFRGWHYKTTCYHLISGKNV